VNYYASTSGGTGSYTYSWTGSCNGYSSSCSNSFSSAGTKTVYLTVTSGTQTKSAYCSSYVGGGSGYIKYYKKSCYANLLYWYDSLNARQSLASNCDDDNTCTADSCSSGKCVNSAKCDGSTCAKGSSDYCSACSHDGDGVCNCGETSNNSNDCRNTLAVVCPTTNSGGLIVTALVKKSTDSNQWSKDLAVSGKQNVDFMIVVNNSTSGILNNVVLRIAVPQEISYSGGLKVDGVSSTADVISGINLGSFSSKEVKTITFSGKTLSTGGETILTATAVSDNFSVSDSLKVNVATSQVQIAGIGSAFSNIFSGGYAFPLLLIITIIILAFVMRTAYMALRRE